MNINEELNKELKTKLYHTLVVIASLADGVGFLICFLLTGLSNPTAMCGACFVILTAFGVYGWVTGKIELASTGMVSIAALLELPILMYVYGAPTSAYLILASVGIALFLPKGSQWVMFGIIFIIDIICIILSYMVPSELGEQTIESEMLTVLWAYAIVAIAVFLLIKIIFAQYEKQREQIVKMTEELALVAHYDQLTGLYNRRYMMDTLEQWMTDLEKDFIVIHIDLDDFKDINDRYGFIFGDSVLVEFAKILKENVSDIGFASRYDGQEFVVMIDKANKEETLQMIEKVKEELAEYSTKTKQALFTFSAGMIVDDKTLDLDEILATADERLHQAKRAGKNQVVV